MTMYLKLVCQPSHRAEVNSCLKSDDIDMSHREIYDTEYYSCSEGR